MKFQNDISRLRFNVSNKYPAPSSGVFRNKVTGGTLNIQFHFKAPRLRLYKDQRRSILSHSMCFESSLFLLWRLSSKSAQVLAPLVPVRQQEMAAQDSLNYLQAYTHLIDVSLGAPRLWIRSAVLSQILSVHRHPSAGRADPRWSSLARSASVAPLWLELPRSTQSPLPWRFLVGKLGQKIYLVD